MRLKSFHGPTLSEAMRLVRVALGDDAIIVATRDDEGGGVRVTAAVDETQSPENNVKPAVNMATASIDVDDGRDGSDVIEIIATTLLRHQIPNILAERFLAAATQSVNDDPVVALGAAFDAHLKFAPFSDDKPVKPLVLIGPPGAGKTLCVAKFATRATLAKKKVAVISADVERAGGMEQLAVFTRLLKLQLMEVEEAHTLREAIAIQPPQTAILVDTPGRNPFNGEERDALRSLIVAAGGEAALVLPACLDALEAIDMAVAFRALGASGLIMTQLDMTRRLGGMLRVALETKLPLMNFSASAKVTEPPQQMNPVALARIMLAKAAE